MPLSFEKPKEPTRLLFMGTVLESNVVYTYVGNRQHKKVLPYALIKLDNGRAVKAGCKFEVNNGDPVMVRVSLDRWKWAVIEVKRGRHEAQIIEI